MAIESGQVHSNQTVLISGHRISGIGPIVQAGLTPREAIFTATRNPSVYFDETDQWGVIKEREKADLVLLGDNPLEDISNYRKIKDVMLRGKWFD